MEELHKPGEIAWGFVTVGFDKDGEPILSARLVPIGIYRYDGQLIVQGSAPVVLKEK